MIGRFALRNQCARAYNFPATPYGVFLEPDHFGSRRSTAPGESSTFRTVSQTPYGLVETLRLWSVAAAAGTPCRFGTPSAPRPATSHPTQMANSPHVKAHPLESATLPLRPHAQAADISTPSPKRMSVEARAGPSMRKPQMRW